MNDNTSETIDNTEFLPNEESANETHTEENVTEKNENNEKMADVSEVEKAQQEVLEWKDKYMRLAAEFDNYKKRSFKEKMETIQTAGKDIIVSLLEVLDDTERAEKQFESTTEVSAIKEGVQLVFNKLKNTLQQKGLKAFDSKETLFDVEKHEAIAEIPAPNKQMEGKVLDEIQKGYMLNDKLIRHAKVVIGKTSE